MREILFRGQNSFSFNWIEGSLLIKDETPDMIMTYTGSKHEVIPETIGQFTGLKDKNGIKIFEGDIISYYDGKKGQEIRYSKDGRLVWKLSQGETTINVIEIYDPLQMEVIGNIYDNPELLKS